MADPSLSKQYERRPEILKSSEDSDRPTSSAASRRRNHYGTQRHEPRRSPPNSNDTARSDPSATKEKEKSSYQYPDDFSNLDEGAIAPPIDNPEDRHKYRRRSALEDLIGNDLDNSPQTQRTKAPRKYQRQPESGDSRVRSRRVPPTGEEELTEVAGPQPIQDSSRNTNGVEHHRFLEDAEKGDPDQDPAEGDESPPYSRKSPEDYLPLKELPQVPKWLTELYTVSYLILFAILGTLARLGVQWLTWYPSAPAITPVLWANFGGSMIFGFLSEDQGLFKDGVRHVVASGHMNGEKRSRKSRIAQEIEKLTKEQSTKHKKTIPLFIGLATGFCGSFTSFSSFARDNFLALSNNLPSPINHPYAAGTMVSTTATMQRNGGYSFEAFLGVILQTLALSLGGLIVGAQLAVFLAPYTPALPFLFIRRFLDRLVVLLAFGCWLGSVFLAIWPPDRPGGPSSRGSWSLETWRGEVIFALCFAPLGCLLRFYASLKLNALVPVFPLGTFAVNMLGTAVEGVCYDIQHVGVGIMGSIGGGRVSCQVLQGLQDGFCGCLTTVSTWVGEINGLKRKHGWLYALGTLLGGLCLMVVIMGSVRWSVGFGDTVCNTGYPDKIHG